MAPPSKANEAASVRWPWNSSVPKEFLCPLTERMGRPTRWRTRSISWMAEEIIGVRPPSAVAFQGATAWAPRRSATRSAWIRMISPSSPASRSSLMRKALGRKRRSCPTMSVTPCRSPARTMARPSSRELASGLVTRMWQPALRAALDVGTMQRIRRHYGDGVGPPLLEHRVQFGVAGGDARLARPRLRHPRGIGVAHEEPPTADDWANAAT